MRFSFERKMDKAFSDLAYQYDRITILYADVQ